MSERQQYECGTCGNHNLIARPGKTVGDGVTWVLECGNGHLLIPTPGTEIMITGETR